MENVWYNAPLTAVSTDINRVGGEYATLGMVRYNHDGRRYVLMLYTGSNQSGSGKIILGGDGGTAYGVDQAASGGRCGGVTTIAPASLVGGSLLTGSYLWMQTYGEATGVMCSGSVLGGFVKSIGSGIGGLLTVQNTIASATTMVGFVGWGASATVSSLANIFVNPGFELE